jgi:Skp family chaperone for outer membrane proteins
MFKKVILALAVVSVFSFSKVASFAEVGVVDLDKVIGSYSKAQDVSADLKTKEAELQKFLADAQKQLKNTSSPIEKKNLEDRLTQEFKTKSDNFRDSQIKSWKQIEDNVFNAIDQTAKSRKIDLVLTKASVLSGGADITDQIITVLNGK